MPMCVLFVFSMSYIVFNPCAGAITDHNQSVKDIDPYFKSQLYMEDPGHRKPILILPNGLNKPGERAHDRNLISAVGFEPTTSSSTVQRVTIEPSPLTGMVNV